MANITVSRILENQLYIFEVIVDENGGQTKHRVSLNKADYHRLTKGDVKPEVLVIKAFEFLLEHEPKESILSEFDFTVISRYFPNFIKEIETKITEK